MIYLFLGKDINIIKKKIEELIDKLNIDNIIRYDSEDTSISNIIDEVNYVDLFNDKKLIIVSSFSLKKLKEKEEKILMDYINHMNENVIIFKCIDESLDERKSLTKNIREKCEIISCEKLDYKGLHAYITDVFNKNNKKINYNQIKRILDICEYNTDVTINEVNKLLLYKMNEDVISDEDIENVISKNNEKEMFTLNENILSKNIGGCFDSYKILIDSKIDPVVILDSIAKQYRMVFQVKELIKNNNTMSISKLLGVNEFVIKKIIPYINNYSENELIDKLVKLSDIDEKIKIYGNDGNELIEMFFLSL